MSEHNTNQSELDTSVDTEAPSGQENMNEPNSTDGTEITESPDVAEVLESSGAVDAAGGFDPLSYVETIVTFFQTGGAFMYPILIVFALGLAISIERYIKLTYERGINRKMWNKLQPVLAEADFDTARELVAMDDKSTISKLMSMGLAREGLVRRREDIEIAMEESMMEIIPQLEKRTPYVALFSNISTLLGLLGTIMGLIAAFTAVANANPAEKADLLSASISVAMNTTAFGLMAGIPLLIIYVFLTSRTGEIIDSLEMASVKTLNVITSASKRRGDKNLSPPEITMSDFTDTGTFMATVEKDVTQVSESTATPGVEDSASEPGVAADTDVPKKPD